MPASNAAAMSSNGQSIIVIEEEEIIQEEIIHKGEQLIEGEEERENTRRRRSARSVSTKAAADTSSQRRRSVEPVRYAQLQDEDAALAKLKYAQQTLFRKGEKRARSNGGGGGRRSSSSTSSSSKRSRAEERRTARQARRRGDARSPTLSSVAEEETDAWRALPAMALDGSGPRSLRFQRPADVVVATVVHSTAWRRVQLRGSPSNLLPLAVLTPFGDDLERPLESYDEALGSACRVRRHESLEDDFEDERTEQQLETEVTRLLADATPLVARCHATRVAHVLSATRQRVRACLAQLPTARRAVSSLCRADVIPSSTVSPLECVVANRQRENVVLPADETDGDDLPTYFVGKGEHAVRERGVLPKEPVRRLPSLPCLSRSTTCIGVRGTLPVDDDPILRSAPVFSSASGDAPPLAAAAPTLSALDDDRQELVLRFVVRATNGDARVFRVLRSLGWSTQPQTDYTTLQIREAHARVVQARQAAEPSVGPAMSTLSTRLRGGIEGDESTAPRFRRELRQAEDGTDDALLAGFRAVFCRRCYVYNCQFHGIHQPCATARTDPEYPPIKTSWRGVFAPAEEERIAEEEEEEAVHEPPTEEEKRAEEDVEMVDVRRSARSVTAAATKASTLLVVQSFKKPAVKRQAKASRRDLHGDPSEYFGYDALYQTITLAKRTAMHRPAKRLKSPESPDAPDTLATSETLAASCSSTCYKTLDATDATVWTPHELLLLQLAHRKAGSRPCVLSHWLATKSCAQVHMQLASMLRASAQQQDAVRVAQDELRLLRAGRRRDDRVASVRGNTPEHLHRTRVQRMKDRGANHQFVPCAGHACNTNDCSCMRRDHFCEQACACLRDCANRFPGCRCATPDVCGTMACLCFFSGRECDPDVCRSCAACDVPLVALDAHQRWKSNKSLRVCANTNILRGAHRRVGVAPSTTHGWGAFAREPIAAHEFIYEYTGELLSQDEAERRGNVYDRNAVSFLFDLNEDVVVDAARKGNKSKFANHAAGDAANCAARIMLVRGDHRIGLYAKRAIAAGEELFFDYGHHGVVPDWSQSRIRPSGVKGMRPGDDSANSTAPSSPGRPTGPVDGEADAMEDEDEAMALVPAKVEAREVVDVTIGDDE